MYLTPDDLFKLMLAILAGGLIGAEREFRDKSAGFRTMILICVGASLFTILSSRLALDKDPTRIAANIVTGIGFLGAGAILRDGNRITGLTTASTIWLTAAVGVGIGGGYWLLAGATALAVLVVLWLFPFIEVWIGSHRHSHAYTVTCPVDMQVYAELDALFTEHRLRVYARKRVKSGEQMTCTWQTTGSPKNHDRLVEKLLTHQAVLEVHF